MLHRIFVLTLLLVSVLGQEEANTDPAEDVSQPEPLSLAERPRGERAEEGDSPPPRRQRPRPGSGSSFGSFLSGFLGSVTKTATADGCPGKCIHAIASLMCDEVITEVSCPASNMRCCVEKSTSSRPKPPPRENVGLLDALDLGLEMPPRPKAEEKVDDDDEEEEEEEKEITSEKPEKKKRKKKKKTTTAAPATTTTKATTKASKSSTEEPDKQKDEESSTSSLSRFSNITLSLAIASLLTFLQTLKNI